jgi:hypothetical protein
LSRRQNYNETGEKETTLLLLCRLYFDMQIAQLAR